MCDELKKQIYDLCDKINTMIESQGCDGHEIDISDLKLILERHRCDMNLQTSELLQELDYVDSF